MVAITVTTLWLSLEAVLTCGRGDGTETLARDACDMDLANREYAPGLLTVITPSLEELGADDAVSVV